MSAWMIQPDCVLGVYEVTSRMAWCGLPFCCPGKQPRFDSKPSELAPYGIETQVEELMQKINAIFVKYGYPPFPIGVMPFIWFFGYYALYVSFSLPDWFENYWFWPIPIWFVIFYITVKYFDYMKPRRIRQEIKKFNQSSNSTGILVHFDLNEISMTQLEIKLTVKMNIQIRQQFCRNTGISFHTPPTFNSPNSSVQQNNEISIVQVEQPPPYNTSSLDHQLPNYEEAIRKY